MNKLAGIIGLVITMFILGLPAYGGLSSCVQRWEHSSR